MIDMTQFKRHYSPRIELYLVAGNERVRLERIGPGYVIPRQGVALNPGPAEIAMLLDGEETIWPVDLLDGMVPFDTHSEVRVRRV